MAARAAVNSLPWVSLKSGAVKWLNVASDKKIKNLIDFLRI